MDKLYVALMLPLLAAACPLHNLSKGKNVYIGSSWQTIQIEDGTHEKLYVLKNVDLKALACLSKDINVGLHIDGIPEFTTDEVGKLCDIPDHCFASLRESLKKEETAFEPEEE